MSARLARIRSTGRVVILHDCCICGSRGAPFGYACDLLAGRLGTWYCAEHRPEFPPAQQTQTATPVLGRGAGQGDLF